MYPTLFRIPFLPDWLADVKSYGVMMMIAFLSGIWLACRRAYRSQANPDIVLNIGFLALIFGVLGARLMYVIHYWDSRFANQAHPILATLDIRAGGLEFWGGPLLVIPTIAIYLRFFAKASVRWYLDITMPSLAWGLAVTRVGCFLNGCCFGSVCASTDPHDAAHHHANVPWAVRFPYGSPAMAQHYKFGQLTLPKELIFIYHDAESGPLPAEAVKAAAKDRGKTRAALEQRRSETQRRLREQTAGQADPQALKRLQAEDLAATKALSEHDRTLVGVVEGHCRKYDMTPQQLAVLADSYRSVPVHPAQLYDTINAFILSWVLSLIFYYRRRHGAVLGWFLILYSVSRILLELIREDNPLDVFGLTISQAISICTLAAGLLWMFLLHTRLPSVSRRVHRFEPPQDDEPAAPVARKAR